MKELLYKAQLFADDAAEQAAETTATESEQTDAQADQGEQVDDRKVAKYSDDDVDRMFNEKFAKWSAKAEKKAEAKAAEAARLAEMTAQERAEAERDALRAELDELKRANTAAEMAKTARQMLSEQGINAPDALVTTLVTDDADSTKQNVDAFAETFKNAVDEEVKKRLGGQTPKVGTGKNKALTREEILAVKDKAERQRLIAENIDEFYTK